MLHGTKRGLRSPPLKSGPLHFRPPNNSGLQSPSCQPLNIMVYRRFEPPSIDNPPPVWPFLFLYFFLTRKNRMQLKSVFLWCHNNMKDFLKPYSKRAPEKIILLAGTNSSINKSSRVILNQFLSLKHCYLNSK